MQGTPKIFFKSLFEFDEANLVSILAFDSRSVSFLLEEEDHEQYFDEKHPLFYKNKFIKIKGNTSS
jgi:hypothetical protein